MNWLGGTVAVILLLLLLGAFLERLAEISDAKAYPPPGKLVDIGGYRLHIHCTGSGAPTVVVDAGWGDSSGGWAWVQPEVSRTARICTYDRAGMGWSEASPQPRTAREYAMELHTLLTNANEKGPFVLVGHSMGAFTMIVYAHDYPGEAAGLVLVDAQALPKPDTTPPQPAPKPGVHSLPSLLARVGLVRLLAGPLGLIQNLPEGDKLADRANTVAPRSVQTFINEGRGIAEGVAQARAVTSLGALPLIVLSAGLNQSADHAASQVDYLKLSRVSQQIIAENSGHTINIDQPQAVIDAIVKIVNQIRG